MAQISTPTFRLALTATLWAVCALPLDAQQEPNAQPKPNAQPELSAQPAATVTETASPPPSAAAERGNRVDLDADAFGLQDASPDNDAPLANDFFDPDDISTRPWYGLPIDLELHGRFDLTAFHFESERNLDGNERNFFNIFNPALNIFWTLDERFQVRAEIEYEGDEGAFELDQLILRTLLPEIEGSADIGITYIPFGIERFYYSTTTNPLVDRPSPFRRIFPGSYADLGFFLRGDHHFDSGWGLSFDGGFSRGLDGPDRDGRSDDYFGEFEPQFSGRAAVIPIEGVEIGVSGLLTWFEEGTRHRQLDLVGIDLLWRGECSHLRAEYIEGSVDRAPGLGGDFRRHGWYVEAYHQVRIERPWLYAIEGVLRVDSVDENKRQASFKDGNRWAFGCNWLPNESFRLKAQYEYNDEWGPEISNDGYFLQLEYHF